MILASTATKGKGPPDSDGNSGSRPAGSPAAGAGARPGVPYLLGALPDFVLLGPGLTLLVSASLGALALGGLADSATSIAVALSLIFVGPHYAATYRRAFSSREILRAHPVVTLVVPLGLAAVAVAAVRWPSTIGVAYFATYVVWSGYHYSGQSLGLALLYPLRQGARLAPAEKRLVAIPLYGSWILSLLGLFRLEVAARNPAYQLTREALFRAPLPLWVLAVAAAIVVGSTASVLLLARRRRAAGRPLPRAVFLVVSAQVLWFCVGLVNPFFNIVLVPVFHGAQYLAITSWHQTRGRSAAVFAAYVATVLLLGLAVNPGLILLGRTLGGEGPVAAAAVLTFINLHHFLMDGRIWRLREKRVADSFGSTPVSPSPAR